MRKAFSAISPNAADAAVPQMVDVVHVALPLRMSTGLHDLDDVFLAEQAPSR